MSKENEVLVVGSVALDDIETPSGRRENALGGSATYFSWACSLFSPVSVVGVVGEDFPLQYLHLLNQRGIDTQALQKMKGKTFYWKGRYDFDFNTAHTLKTELNVFANFNPQLFPYQSRMKYLFLANIDPVIQLKVAQKMKNSGIIATDTMNYWIEKKKKDLLKVLEITDFLLVNDAEARQLGGEANLISACRRILSWGPKIVIVKQGEYGVRMFHLSKKKEKIETFSVPSIPLETIIDPTGAGDSFAGAFMGYLASQRKTDEKTLRLAVAMGSVVASFTVEGFSLEALEKVNLKNVYQRFHDLRNITYFEDLREAYYIT